MLLLLLASRFVEAGLFSSLVLGRFELLRAEHDYRWPRPGLLLWLSGASEGLPYRCWWPGPNALELDGRHVTVHEGLDNVESPQLKMLSGRVVLFELLAVDAAEVDRDTFDRIGLLLARLCAEADDPTQMYGAANAEGRLAAFWLINLVHLADIKFCCWRQAPLTDGSG